MIEATHALTGDLGAVKHDNTARGAEPSDGIDKHNAAAVVEVAEEIETAEPPVDDIDCFRQLVSGQVVEDAQPEVVIGHKAVADADDAGGHDAQPRRCTVWTAQTRQGSKERTT